MTIALFQKYFIDKQIRLIGIKLDNLVANEINLFNSEIINDIKDTIDINQDIIQSINKKFQKNIIDNANNKLK
jgi:hypothetical protein